MVEALIHLIIVCAIIGLGWWLLVTYVPLPAPAKTVISVIVSVVLIILALRFLVPFI